MHFELEINEETFEKCLQFKKFNVKMCNMNDVLTGYSLSHLLILRFILFFLFETKQNI